MPTEETLRAAAGICTVYVEEHNEPHNYQCTACGSHVAGWRAPALRDGRPVCGDCERRPAITKKTAFHGL